MLGERITADRYPERDCRDRRLGHIDRGELRWSYHGRTIRFMSSVVKRSVSLPADVFEALEQQASEEGRSVSAALADAADLWLATRRGLRAVRAWEREHGALSAEELAVADRKLDRVGVGRH